MTICCGWPLRRRSACRTAGNGAVQPLVGLVDAGIGHVGKVAAGLHQIGLAGQVAPDDAHLLAARWRRNARRAHLRFRRRSRRGNLRAQLARGVPVQLAGPHQVSNIKGSRTLCSITKSLAAATRANCAQRSGVQADRP
jgi:hypothetical protein